MKPKKTRQNQKNPSLPLLLLKYKTNQFTHSVRDQFGERREEAKKNSGPHSRQSKVISFQFPPSLFKIIMFSGIGSYFWGSASSDPSPATSAQRNKKLLLETEVTGSDGDEWVLINEGSLSAGRAASRKSGNASPSGSPQAKKSRSRKSGTPGRLVLGSAAPALQYVSGRKMSGKIHRRRVPDDAILTEGDKLLHEIERGDFPTIEEGLKSCSSMTKTSGAAAASRAAIRSYAEIAKKLPPAASDDNSSSTPSPQSLSATATTTSCSSDASSSCEELLLQQERTVPAASLRRKSPAIIIVNSHSQHPTPSSSSLSLGKSKKKKKKHVSCHGLNGQMEGSWFVTPPPCFTKPNTFDMTSSPLEDMLIEKPVIRSPAASEGKTFVPEDQEEDDRAEDEVLLSPVHSSPVPLIASLTAAQAISRTATAADITNKPHFSCGLLVREDQETGGYEADGMPDLESSNDSLNENEADDEGKHSNSHYDEEDAESITTSVSSVTDHEEDQDENDCMSPPPATRGRKRSRQVARSSGLMPPANSSLTEVQLNSYRILSRKERKGRKAQKRKNRQRKQTGESETERTDEVTGISKRSASSERLLSAIRALAYEPVLQSKAMQDQSQKIFLKSSFLDRQNHVIHHHHHSHHASSRKIKYATRPHTFSTNRKTNRNC